MTFAYISAGIALYSVNQAGDSADTANALSGEALAFSIQQYEDWKAIYGSLEQNLADFYNNLTPDYIEAQGLQEQELAYQESTRQLTEYFAVNNIDSGVSTDLFTKSVLQNERDKAQIRADAPFEAAELQLDFLNLGLGQKSSATDGVTDALNDSAAIAADQAATGFDIAGNALDSSIDLFKNKDDDDDNNLGTANTGSTEIN